MFKRGYGTAKEADAAYSLGGWVFRTLEIAFPTSVAAMIAWAASYRDWIWNDYGMLGVLGVGICAAILASFAFYLSGLGIRAWRGQQEKIKQQPQPIPEAKPEVPAATLLSHDQLQFRIALKQIAMTYPPRLFDTLARVRRVQTETIKSFGAQDYSYAFYYLLHNDWTRVHDLLTRIDTLAAPATDKININALQETISTLFGEYEWQMKGIANFNVLAKLDLKNLPETQKWLEVDKDCLRELDRLKVWPELSKQLRLQNESRMAATETNWTTPFKVNW